MYERRLVNTVNVEVQGIVLRWRNRPSLLSRDWECIDSERQMGEALLDDDVESKGCRSPVREQRAMCVWTALWRLKSGSGSGLRSAEIRSGALWSGGISERLVLVVLLDLTDTRVALRPWVRLLPITAFADIASSRRATFMRSAPFCCCCQPPYDISILLLPSTPINGYSELSLPPPTNWATIMSCVLAYIF